MAPSKFLVGVLATCLLAIGIAAQTGTVHVAGPGGAGHAATVTHQPATVMPRLQVVHPAPLAPAPAPPAAAPVQPGGDGEGDGGGD